MQRPFSGRGGTSLSAAKGVAAGETTPFAALRDVPPKSDQIILTRRLIDVQESSATSV